MRSLLLFALLSLIGYSAHAETWLSSSVLSFHLDRDSGKNERNFGVGIKHFVDERNVIAAGVYRNSNDIDSGYLVGGRCFYRSSYACGGGIFGLVTGYEEHAIVMGGLVLTLHGKKWGASLAYFPKDSGVFGLQIERRFW